jgi:DNA helicase-2/ATP-dependent DNA helicase PcrA
MPSAPRTSAEIEEEWRQLYVAMTRAKDDLHLVVPQRFFIHRQHASTPMPKRTRFISEHLLGLFEKITWRPAVAGLAQDRRRVRRVRW